MFDLDDELVDKAIESVKASIVKAAFEDLKDKYNQVDINNGLFMDVFGHEGGGQLIIEILDAALKNKLLVALDEKGCEVDLLPYGDYGIIDFSVKTYGVSTIKVRDVKEGE